MSSACKPMSSKKKESVAQGQRILEIDALWDDLKAEVSQVLTQPLR